MLDSDSHIWSVRRSKANWFRVVGCLSRVGSFLQFRNRIRTWAHPPMTVLALVLWAAAVLCLHLILPTIFMYMFLVLVLRFRYRRRATPGGIDPRLSCTEAASPDKLDEEFDSFPMGRAPDAVRIRFDRLRAQAVVGERLEALLNWRDPKATGILAVL
ncbi:hypothetical protein MLD38_015882 [Melastoma candidum]|uniref:Uncharacterized protein n=1 Tax=Melastoma candidum TaxID=119954 RepID=A0ACB9RHT2_9MYRT|nr:hypothetical protein MLD38_015882 [Melastoma candidum]